MFWIAIEDADTHEVSDFEKVTEGQVFYLMDGYRVDKNKRTEFRMQDTENGKNIIYEGVTYKGSFGLNLWIARKYLEL